MKKKVNSKNSRYRRICAILIIAEVFSCLTLPVFIGAQEKETTYINESVNSASYYYENDTDISNKFKELTGKNVAIIGDSISTFEGYIPQGYKHFYKKADVDTVEETWWGQLVKKTGVNIVANCSWSGSTVTGDSLSRTYAHAACSDKRIADIGMSGEKIDIIICYIGINDYRRNVKLGNWSPDDDTVMDSTNIHTFSEGYALMINKLKENYPDARVYVTTLMNCDDDNLATYELDSYNDVIKAIADKYNTGVIDLNQFLIDKDDYSEYTIDRLHPNALGHKYMCDIFAQALCD